MDKANTEYKGIKISPLWDCVLSFEQVCNNANFSFTAQIASDERLYIVMLKPIADDIDLLEISHDRYGVIVGGESKFNPNWGVQIIDSTKVVTQMVKTWLRKQGASDLITDEPITMNDLLQ